ncbi:MAG: HNH endonuclease [Paludibacteraceae bacterium]|nr:HNH endonuclease [Paludibacteraceae bacterium]
MLQNQLRLIDGTIVRKDPVENIYSSENGDFYSPHKAILTDQGWIMRKLKAEISKRTAKSSHGGDYPKLRAYGNSLCHTLIARTWIGPRPFYKTPDGQIRPMEVDHLNGNILDWSASNLQYVTPAENRKRARLLRVLRSIGRDPRRMSRTELLEIFNKYDFTNPQNLD